jgi:hypothetical protein
MKDNEGMCCDCLKGYLMCGDYYFINYLLT